MDSMSNIINLKYKNIDHIGIAVSHDRMDETIHFIEKLGGKLVHTGYCKEFKTYCSFIKFKNIEVEIISGPFSDKYAKKYGGVVLHHLAIEGDGNEKIEGAKPLMHIKFVPIGKTKLLIEKVTYGKNNIWNKIRQTLLFWKR